MSIGEGLAFAALMWAIVQISYLFHARSRTVTLDEVKDRMDRIAHHLEECIGPPAEPYTNPKEVHLPCSSELIKEETCQKN